MPKTKKTQTDFGFEEFYILHFARMKRFARQFVQEEAEDLVQDVFKDIWERWDRLSPPGPSFGYLMLSVKNRCIDFLRRNTVSRHARDVIRDATLIERKASINILENFHHIFHSSSELYDFLYRAIDSLPPQCREIFRLHKIEGKKQSDIARELHLTLNTIETQMGIAYKKLRKIFSESAPSL